MCLLDGNVQPDSILQQFLKLEKVSELCVTMFKGQFKLKVKFCLCRPLVTSSVEHKICFYLKVQYVGFLQ